MAHKSDPCPLCLSVWDLDSLRVVCTDVRDSNDGVVAECPSCSLTFLARGRVDDTFYKKEYFRLYAPPEKKAERLANMSRRRELLEEKIKAPDVRILDIGAGCGDFLLSVRSINPTASLHAMEIQQEYIDRLNRAGVKTYDSVAAVDGTFELVTLFQVLEHIENITSFLGECKRVLSPTGVLVCEVPHNRDALNAFYRIKEFQQLFYWKCHVSYFTMESLYLAFERSGFNTISVCQVQRYPFRNHLYWLWKRKPRGHVYLDVFRDDRLDAAYAAILERMGICDTLWCIAS